MSLILEAEQIEVSESSFLTDYAQELYHKADCINSSTPISDHLSGRLDRMWWGHIYNDCLVVPFNPEQAAVETPTKEWYLESKQKLESLKLLEDNWNSYGSEAPSLAAIYRSEQFLKILQEVSLPAPQISASAEGGVGFSYFISEKTATIEFLNSFEVVAVVSDRIKSPYAWEVKATPVAYLETLAEIQRFLQVA